jgi:hypothetical protein
MTTTATNVQELSDRFNRMLETLEPDDDLFTEDAFYDLLPPFWRFQIEGPANYLEQLKVITGPDARVEVIRTVPTATGFVTEHVQTHTPEGKREVARRLCLCEVRDGRIAEVSIFCNGGWDDELRARHAADAPMLRP